MELSKLGIPEKKQKQLEKANIHTIEELVYLFPRKYIDRSRITGVELDLPESVFMFQCKSVRYVNAKLPLIVADGFEVTTQLPIQVKWFNQSYLYDELKRAPRHEFLVAGQVTRNTFDGHFEVTNPAVFDPEGTQALGIYPVYRKIPGMAEYYLRDCISKAMTIMGPPEDIVPNWYLERYNLMAYSDMIYQLHWPESQQRLEAAQRRKLMNDLMYFAIRVELNHRGVASGSPFTIPTICTTTAVRQNLPFQLTPDQEGTVNEIIQNMQIGKRVNALVQGDVGSGKTIVAFLIMVAVAESGYQAALMAPTQILAQQHYEKLSKLVEPYGIKVAFVSGQKLRKAEQAELEKQISSGEAKLIVGTQALLGGTYSFKDLALVVEDEEHKYGVMQRQALIDKAANGTHIVTMSATPIPRSLALTIYGTNIQLYSIKTKPAGRKPVLTGIQHKMEPIYRYLYSEIVKKGHQAYVVCPMVTSSEKIPGVASAEETYLQYYKALSPYGITVGMVTGKTKKEEAQEIIQDFSENRISVLVSTTVIEVGVDVPNATCIVIQNAERFGLAQLHQLRGRVGRGSEQACCVLFSSESNNPRLQAMCQTHDGFQIAEIDLKLRGAGNLLGSQQSGSEKLLDLALRHPLEFREAQACAKEIFDRGQTCKMLEQAKEDQKNFVGGEMLED